MPLTAAQYRALKDRNTRYEMARRRFDPSGYERGRGYSPIDLKVIEQMARVKAPTNKDRSDIEVYEFLNDPPSRYFAYYDNDLRKITNWMGVKLGAIIDRGSPWTSNMGDRRVNVVVRAINGREYVGTCFLTSGTYCRLRVRRKKAKRSATPTLFNRGRR